MHETDTATEECLEPFQTYVIRIFCEKNYQVLALNSSKSSITETDMVLNTLLATDSLKKCI